MNRRLVAASAGALLLLVAAGWMARDTAPMQAAATRLGLAADRPLPTTTETLHAAGVHKCQSGGGILYVDAACPKGSRELKADHGTVTVMPFPKPPPAVPSFASGALGGPLVRPLDPAERDRIRDKMIEDAANRK